LFHLPGKLFSVGSHDNICLDLAQTPLGFGRKRYRLAGGGEAAGMRSPDGHNGSA